MWYVYVPVPHDAYIYHVLEILIKKGQYKVSQNASQIKKLKKEKGYIPNKWIVPEF